jgi:PAS domain S-box-containing protein
MPPSLKQKIHRRRNQSECSGNHPSTCEILKYVPVGIYHIDLINLRLLMVNDYMCATSGYTEEELLASNPMDILTPQSRAVLYERLQQMAKGKSVSSDLELEIIKKNGETEWGQFNIHHIYKNGRISSAYVVVNLISEQKRIQELLASHRHQLKKIADDRTSELARANQQLREEIEQRILATEKLRVNSERLENINTAMRVLLDKRNEDHLHAEELIRLTLRELISPYLERLEHSNLNRQQKQLVEVIRMNLEQVVSSATPAISSKYFMFSPNELQVVNLIRSGKTTKEMARLLNLSTRTVEAYRNSIRKKLNLKNKKVNLRTYLSSL